jgi:hypothetical protein
LQFQASFCCWSYSKGIKILSISSFPQSPFSLGYQFIDN